MDEKVPTSKNFNCLVCVIQKEENIDKYIIHRVKVG